MFANAMLSEDDDDDMIMIFYNMAAAVAILVLHIALGVNWYIVVQSCKSLL